MNSSKQVIQSADTDTCVYFQSIDEDFDTGLQYKKLCIYFHCLGILLIWKILYIGALSVKTLLPSLVVDSYFHAGPINQDAAAPPIKPPN